MIPPKNACPGTESNRRHGDFQSHGSSQECSSDRAVCAPPCEPVVHGLSWLVPERFWSKVDKNGPVPVHRPDLGPCWTWVGGKTGKNYGLVREGHDGPRHLVHRVSWELANGPIPDDLFVLHACDNPPCLRPSHLSLGTHQDNMADCAAKGRTKDQRGSRHGLTRLTDADVVAMREAWWLRGEKLKDISSRFGICESTASYILHGKTWTHVPMPANDGTRRSA